MKSPLWIICAVIVAFASSLSAAAVWWSHEHHRSANGLVIVAVAHEWWWDFQYPGLGIAHDSELHLPVGIPVHLTLTSADVLHSFWLPGLKHSVSIMPGQPGELDLTLRSPGHFFGNCDVGCGCGTVCMRFAVLADDHERFSEWVKAKRAVNSVSNVPPRNTAPPPCAFGESNQQESPSAANRLAQLLQGHTIPAHSAKHASLIPAHGEVKDQKEIL